MCTTFVCAWDWVVRNAQAIIALLALFLTVFQARAAWRHNRVSVKPRLVLYADRHYPDKHKSAITVTMQNYGLGPAFIDSIEYLVMGREVQLSDRPALERALREVFTDRAADVQSKFDLHGTYAIAKDGELPLVSVLVEEYRKPDWEDASEIVRRCFGIRIRYHSPYNEQMMCEWPEAGAQARRP
jgi:hypothetical protein